MSKYQTWSYNLMYKIILFSIEHWPRLEVSPGKMTCGKSLAFLTGATATTTSNLSTFSWSGLATKYRLPLSLSTWNHSLSSPGTRLKEYLDCDLILKSSLTLKVISFKGTAVFSSTCISLLVFYKRSEIHLFEAQWKKT